MSKEKINKWYKKKWYIWYRALGYFTKTCLYLSVKRPIQAIIIIKKNNIINNQQPKMKELKNFKNLES